MAARRTSLLQQRLQQRVKSRSRFLAALFAYAVKRRRKQRRLSNAAKVVKLKSGETLTISVKSQEVRSRP